MLQQAIASAQSAGRDTDVIVVDDASTDATATICKSLPGITYLRIEENVGQAQARNVGIANSSGEYLAFLDDDDLRLPGSIDKQAEILSRHKDVGFVYGKTFRADPNTCESTNELRPKHCPVGDIFWQLLGGNFIYSPSVLVRRRSFEAVGLFDPDPGLRGAEDWDAWIRLAADYTVDAIDEPVATYRDFSPTSGQTSSNRPRMCRASARTLAKALRSARGLEREPAASKKLWTDYSNLLWENLVREGRRALSARQYHYAATNFATAIQLRPARAARFGAVSHFTMDAIRAVRKNAIAFADEPRWTAANRHPMTAAVRSIETVLAKENHDA